MQTLTQQTNETTGHQMDIYTYIHANANVKVTVKAKANADDKCTLLEVSWCRYEQRQTNPVEESTQATDVNMPRPMPMPMPKLVSNCPIATTLAESICHLPMSKTTLHANSSKHERNPTLDRKCRPSQRCRALPGAACSIRQWIWPKSTFTSSGV